MRKLVIFTAPSGAGKTTIVRHLLDAIDVLDFSISATTRPPRPGEIDGRDYYFVSNERFRELIQQGAFVEWEEVYPGRFYGTLRSEIDRLWADGKAIIFDIDVKGALSLQQRFPEESLTIFVKPPSIQVLQERLRTRSTESEDSLRIRTEQAANELKYENKFDRVLVNNILSTTLITAETMVRDFLSV